MRWVPVVPESEVREKFQKLKPFKDISTKQRGWTLDVLNIVRRVTSSGNLECGGMTPLSSLDDMSSSPKAPSCRRTPKTSRPSDTFTNEDIYVFVSELEKLHPDNRHIRDKIRQQLQVLRDTGFLIHVGNGEWRVR